MRFGGGEAEDWTMGGESQIGEEMWSQGFELYLRIITGFENHVGFG